MDDRNKWHKPTDEEIEEILKDIPDDPVNEVGKEPEPPTGDPLYDRWIAEEDSIRKYGL